MAAKKPKKLDPHMDLVGRISAAWSILDLSIEATIWMILNASPNELSCVTSQFNSHYPKLKAIIALAKQRGLPASSIKEITTFMARLNELAERRNRVIHDPWLLTDGKIVGKVDFSGARPAKDTTTAELRSLLSEIEKRTTTYRTLRTALLAEFRSLPRKRV